jgi:hypothetical protein
LTGVSSDRERTAGGMVGVSRPRASRLTPLWRLPVLEPLQGFFWRADFTLVARRVIRDCLESS